MVPGKQKSNEFFVKLVFFRDTCYNGVNINYRGEGMELGEKLLQARLEAGLSQRQLCGDTITRNMLSQIEHGTAKPSMGTLKTLAARLEKPVSYFLDEEAQDNTAVAEALSLLEKAETAIGQKKYIFAGELLGKIDASIPELERRRLLLMARLPGASPEEICERLPSLDEELLLRARAALAAGQWSRCLHLLEAMDSHAAPEWNLLRGELHLAQKDYAQAAKCFHAAEEARPAETAAKLERCYRELGDFKQAYFYACKQKK